MKTSVDSHEPGDEELPRPFQIKSYNSLLQFPAIPRAIVDISSGKRAVTDPPVDAIVVPTIRSVDKLHGAARLAAAARCHLIVVYTDHPPAGLSAVLDAHPPGQVTVLAVRSDLQDRLLDLGVSLAQRPLSPAALDISRKRNLGLLIGRMCGWTRLLFLDDDIRRLNVAKLSSAAALLDDYPVVGFQVTKYPDASVVGHARRLTGRRQEPFVSGGSLLVDPQRLDGYFAPVYHEDWLCLINHLRKGEVAVGGPVGQLPYLPFTTPVRAQLEEFGDILLSGLLWLIYTRKQGTAGQAHLLSNSQYWLQATDRRFWEPILDERTALLQDITTRLAQRDFYTTSPLPSLAAARQRLSELRPDDFASFVANWLASLDRWSAGPPVLLRVDQADTARAIEKALAVLGISHVVPTHEPSSQPAFRTAGFAARWGSRERSGVRRFGMRRWP